MTKLEGKINEKNWGKYWKEKKNGSNIKKKEKKKKI